MSETLSSPRAPVALSWPNLLTYLRIAAVPVLVVSLALVESRAGHLVAFAVFVIASVTDWLDGYLARAYQQQSSLGRMLDPIADKLLVGAALMMLVADQTIAGTTVFAAVIILSREILVSGLREYLAGLSVPMPVTVLAKFKTGVQMVAIGFILIAPVFAKTQPWIGFTGLALLWLAALMTLWTGYDYLKASLREALKD